MANMLQKRSRTHPALALMRSIWHMRRGLGACSSRRPLAWACRCLSRAFWRVQWNMAKSRAADSACILQQN